MAFLLDLPTAARRELAARWGVEETTALLYRAMTDPGTLEAQLAAVGPTARRTLDLLARAPASIDEILAGAPTSRERLELELDALGALGLVLRLPEREVPPRPARAPFGSELLYL